MIAKGCMGHKQLVHLELQQVWQVYRDRRPWKHGFEQWTKRLTLYYYRRTEKDRTH